MRSVLVTGGSGFLGRAVCNRFRSAGWRVEAPSHEELDLVSQGRFLRWLDSFFQARHRLPVLIVHCAGRVGGIGANRIRPATFFADNMRMGLNVLDAATSARIPVVVVGTTCSYPGDLQPPFVEAQLWSGYPEPTNAPYGIAKRALIAATEAYAQEFGLRATSLVLANLYGVGASDDLTLSHVVPAIVRKVSSARARSEKSITLWGDGSPTRDLLYVDDAARAVLIASESFFCDEPMNTLGRGPYNVGTGVETSIRELAMKIIALSGASNLEIVWDGSQPNGQQRRALDASAFRYATDWVPMIPLEEGLTRIIHERAST